MKNKIKHFSKGDFHVAHPDVAFSETHLLIVVGEGEIYQGSFVVKNRKGGNIRGLVYPSSFRVKMEEQGFDGNPVELVFTYDGRGLKPGHVEQGRFTVVCNGGEYDISFTAIIERPYIMTSYGKVQNARDFKKLALQDFTEAQRLFRSRDFYEVIKYEEPKIRALYDNMRKWSLGEQAMEEFLVAIKQKECIFLTMGRTQRTFRNLREATKETIHFTKNTWGYMPVKVHVDGDFIQIGRNQFTTDDFVGNLFDFSYIIHPEKAHAGNNYGKIVFESPYESLVYEVTLANHKPHPEDRRLAGQIMADVLRGFLECQSGQKKLANWADQTRARLKTLDIYTGDQNVYPLIDAHLCLLCDEYRKAGDILEGYSYNRFALGGDAFVSSYYLYLTALLKKSGSHVNRVVEELNKAYMKNPRSWELVCMLVDIDPEYRNYSKRLHVLERHYNNGANQIILYWQALSCFLKQPNSLKKLGSFELQILGFALKYNLMTKEIALYTANLATQQRNYDAGLEKLLSRLYLAFPDTMILSALCTQMIRGNRTDRSCFEWYERAVEADLRIAQLYEYYMMTIDDDFLVKEFPKSIYLYFMHGNSLNYKKAAVLYANVITFQDETGELYASYREQMERFAWEQLEHRRISNTLRIIYKRCCAERDFTAERTRAMSDICHAYEVRTKMPNMAFVMVITPDSRISMRVPYNPEGTIVFLYDKESRIVWESRDGRHYMDSIPYETMRLFYESRYMELYRKYGQDERDTEHRWENRELNMDSLREYGLDAFSDEDVFRYLTLHIREDGYEENSLMVCLCYQLFERGFSDKVTLTYLAEYYLGATLDMKKLWHAAREQDVTTYKLAERIITQMLFSEMMFGEEEIFSDYYEGRTYFRLKQAYLAYVSREYVLNDRQVKGCVFAIIANEYRRDEDLPDICKIALLKYYSCREIHEELQPMLLEFLRELCEKQLYFSFYLNYPEGWLREVQLYDKSMIEYHARPGSKVTIHYQIRRDENDGLNYRQEVLLPSYEDTYIKTFILFEDETLRYFFTETNGDDTIATDKQTYEPKTGKEVGRYGRLNGMTALRGRALADAMTEYAAEKALADEIFVAY